MVEPIIIEPLFNRWTVDHLLFGLGTALIIKLLSRSRHRVFLISSSIMVLWELFEYRISPTYWVANIANNLVDIVVGVAGVLIIQGLAYLYDSRQKGGSSHSSGLSQK